MKKIILNKALYIFNFQARNEKNLKTILENYNIYRFYETHIFKYIKLVL